MLLEFIKKKKLRKRNCGIKRRSTDMIGADEDE